MLHFLGKFFASSPLILYRHECRPLARLSCQPEIICTPLKLHSFFTNSPTLTAFRTLIYRATRAEHPRAIGCDTYGGRGGKAVHIWESPNRIEQLGGEPIDGEKAPGFLQLDSCRQASFETPKDLSINYIRNCVTLPGHQSSDPAPCSHFLPMTSAPDDRQMDYENSSDRTSARLVQESRRRSA